MQPNLIQNSKLKIQNSLLPFASCMHAFHAAVLDVFCSYTLRCNSRPSHRPRATMKGRI